jgi:hypothetical protein
LERTIHRIEQINTMASVSMIVGLMALVRQMASGEITAPYLNLSTGRRDECGLRRVAEE